MQTRAMVRNMLSSGAIALYMYALTIIGTFLSHLEMTKILCSLKNMNHNGEFLMFLVCIL